MIVVTGATGNVGRPLVEALTAAGEEVAAISRREADLPAGAVHHRADLTEPESLGPAFEGAEKLFLLSNDPRLDMNPILKAAKTAGVARVVLLSSQRVISRPEEGLAASEEPVITSSLEWTILRPGAFHSNAFLWSDAVRSRRSVAAPFGDVSLPVIDPLDIAEVAVKALTEDGHAGRAYTLTGPELVTPREQAEAIAAAIGEPVAFIEQTRAQAREQLLQYLPAEVVDGSLDVIGAPNEIERAVTGEVERILGREPVTFADWAKRNAPAFRG